MSMVLQEDGHQCSTCMVSLLIYVQQMGCNVLGTFTSLHNCVSQKYNKIAFKYFYVDIVWYIVTEPYLSIHSNKESADHLTHYFST